MAYSPTVWVAGVTTLGPTNLNKLESGLQVAASVADAAVPKPGAPTDRDVLFYDSLTSSWKAGKLTDAMVTAAAGIAKSKLAALAVTDADVAVGAAINPNKLAPGAGATLGQMLGADPISGAIGLFGGAQLLADTTLGSAAATIDFQNIPATFKHLLLYFHGRGDAVVGNEALVVRFNNDSTAAYVWSAVSVSDTGAVTGVSTTGASPPLGQFPGASATAGRTGGIVVFIPNYSQAVAQKNAVGIGGAYTSVAGTYFQASVMGWTAAVAAINRVTLLPGSAGNFVANTRATLYGLG